MSPIRATYDVVEEPIDETYRSLIYFAASVCAEFILVHQRRRKTVAVDQLLQDLAPSLVLTTEESAWPGSELALGHRATVYRFRVDPVSTEVLATAAVGLYSWTQLQRLEDPCFFRSDRSLWLATIAHERDAYFELFPAECEELLAKVPGLQLKLRRRA